MQTADLIELAAIVALHGPTLVANDSVVSIDSIEQYWTASKCRFERWAVALGRVKRDEPPTDDESAIDVRALLEEIFGSEVLTRIWTATVAAFDRRRDAEDNEIIARSVYIGQLEMRHRALKLLVTGPGITAMDAVELNRLRRRAEQWTDLLLASLAPPNEVREFAFEADRMSNYAVELSGGNPARSALSSDPGAFVQTTIRSVVRHTFVAPAANADLNSRVAATVLHAFPSSLFDAHGLFRSRWVMRLAQTADDAQQLVDALFHPEPFDPGPMKASRRLG